MRWALAVGLLLLATGCGSTHHVVFSQSGRIGPLQTDRNSRADVIAFAGRPDAPLTVPFDGAHPHKLHGCSELHLAGGHVYAFALRGRRSDIGVFDCL